MQGQRSATGSLPDPINFDFGSTSSNIGVDQQICWNNLRDPAESRLSDYGITPGGSDAYMGSISQEARNLGRWSIGEPSSSNPQNLNSHDEQMTQNGWWSSVPTSGGAGPRQDSQLYEPSVVGSRNSVNLNLNINQVPSEPSFVRSSTQGAMSRNDDINVEQLDQVGGDPMDCSNSLKPGGLEHRLFLSSSGSDPFASSSGSSGFLVEEDDGRSVCPLDGRRLSCKRKTIEGNVGQSSDSGSYFSREGNMWQAIPPRYNAGSSSNISPQLETSAGVNNPDSVNSGLDLNMFTPVFTPVNLLASSAASGAESSQRNHHSRMIVSTHQGSFSYETYDQFLSRTTSGHSDVQSGHQPPRLVPVNPPPELVPPVHPENVASEGQSVVFNLPSMRRNVQSARLGGASRSRAGSLSNSVVSGERDTSMNEDLNSRSMPRNISDHPMVMPSAELGSNLAQYPPNWNSNGGSLGMPRHIGSGSRAGAGSSSHSTLGPSWGSSRRHPSSQYSRRLSEYVRRSLLSSAGSEIGGHAGSSSIHRPVPSLSQEVVLPSGGVNQPSSWSSPWIDRQGDGVLGLPYSLRTLPAAGEGRTRLVSEIRNVLDMMRRGEGLRFEDVMVLDPSVFFGMPDIHDQHRDMRLDVDNMSYEELLALEDRIGSVCTGLTEETVAARMKQRKYFAVARSDQAEVEPCCICQEQYTNGEDLGTLDCGHDFHTECIKQWLGQKNLCPICKTTGLAT